jgi:putative membrane protein
MSSYLATIEDRGTVPGMSLGPMIGSLQGLEDCLTTLEKILTTPLPFVYSAHIRHTVWLYLFFLPFQICETFGCKRGACERIDTAH